MKSQQAAASASAESGKSDESQILEKLLKENAELRRQVQRLGVQQTHFAHRLQRVEDSQIFRFLRWLGGHVLDLPPWLLRFFPTSRFLGAGGTLSYQDWIEQSAVMDAVYESRRKPAESTSSPLVSVLVWKGGQGPEDRCLASIGAQSYDSREVHFCTDESAEGFRNGLAKCGGEFVAIVPTDVILEPNAIAHWLDAVSLEVDLVYSDWDHIDAQGRRHTPRFTPEFSPTLLEQGLYWGDCFLVRTELLRRVASLIASGSPFLLHQVALEATRYRKVARIPRILWHQTGEVRNPLKLTEGFPGAGNLQPVPAYTASIIICTRSPERLRRCLASLRPTVDSKSTEIIVVHHETGKSDGVSEVVAQFGAKVVPYRGAFHFGLMNALGARAASGSILVLLNDDVFPMAAGWLDHMARHALKPDVAAVGALLLYPSGKIQHAGVVVGGMSGATHIGRLMRQAPYWPWLTASREVTAVTGACMAIRRDIWDELGGFDPQFPVNYNDVDLCLRARRQGYRVVLETRATLTHEESQTRSPGVRPEEMALFTSLWGDVLGRPDPYFHPDLALVGRDIPLRSPWARLA